VIRIKICGLKRRQDAELAVELGADALGFVFEARSPRYLGERVPEWLAELPVWPARVAVFGVETDHAGLELFDGVQAVEPAVTARAFRHRIAVCRLPGPGEVPQDLAQDLLSEARDRSGEADALLLDASAHGSYGGTGKTVDWDLAAKVVGLRLKPVILAGGLTPDNVAEAIRRVRPYAVDVSSGIESAPGVKDAAKLRDFIQAARNAL
jgi:phosphoribosylanthranilate isomerase